MFFSICTQSKLCNHHRYFFPHILLATGEEASSLSPEVLTVSSDTASLGLGGPGGPGGGWASGACSHHLGGALDSCRAWTG